MSNTAAKSDALLQVYKTTLLPNMRREMARQLDLIWPGIRCAYDEMTGLRVYFRLDLTSFEHLPSNIVQAADYIEEVRLDGRAKIWKNSRGSTGDARPTRRVADFGTFPRPARSVWDLLLEED